MEEVWHPVVGWEALYEVSSLGRVRSLDRRIAHWRGGTKMQKGRILYVSKDRDGYCHVHLCRDGARSNCQVHVLVAQAFCLAKLKPHYSQVLHSNSNPSDNRPANLRYGDQSENEKDKLLVGTSNRGVRNTKAKLTELQVCNIKRQIYEGESCIKIAQQYNVSNSAIFDIKAGRSWGWLMPYICGGPTQCNLPDPVTNSLGMS